MYQMVVTGESYVFYFGIYIYMRCNFKVIEKSRDVPPRSKYEKSKGHPRSPCAPNMVQLCAEIFELNLAPSVRKADQRMSVRFGHFLYRVILLTSQVATFVPWQRSH